MKARFLQTQAKVQVTCADVSLLLTRLSQDHIFISGLQLLDPLTVRFYIPYKDLKRLRVISEKHEADLHILGLLGFGVRAKAITKRPVLLLGVLLLCFLTWYLPTRVLFIQVRGNAQLPDRQILEAAEKAGIRFGATNSEVRSEKVKNKMLQQLNALQWVGVNTTGCVVTISVREAQIENVKESAPRTISSIVADSDGIVTSITVEKGVALCAPGQAVKKGQTLISGYSDLGLLIRATGAKGEVYAQTRRVFTAKTPECSTVKGGIIRQEKKYSLLLGKKLIKFYKYSGILPPSCGKMYKQIPVTLADGLQLPVWLCIETLTYFDSTEPEAGTQNRQVLESGVEAYLRSHAVAAKILDRKEILSDGNTLTLEYTCHEMIGREQPEELIAEYGKNY